MMNIREDRQYWLDALRGMAMIFVVYGHCVRGWTEYFVFTSPVKMPLFFVISAYLFKPRGGDSFAFLKSMFKRIVVPWIVLGMIPFLHPVDRFFALISGKVLWFMPCFIISEILWFYVLKFQSKDIQIILTGLTLSLIGFLISHFHPIRFAMIDTALVVQSFFVIGYLIRKYETLISQNWQQWISVIFFIYMLLAEFVIVFYPNQLLDVHLNIYFNLPVCFLMIIGGCLSLFVLFKQKNFSPRWLVFIGQNTMVVYILHGFFIGGLYRLLSPNNLPLPVFGAIRTIIALFFCCIIAYLINKYIPEVVGKKRMGYNTKDKVK